MGYRSMTIVETSDGFWGIIRGNGKVTRAKTLQAAARRVDGEMKRRANRHGEVYKSRMSITPWTVAGREAVQRTFGDSARPCGKGFVREAEFHPTRPVVWRP